jgi:hypothetical protein
LTNRSIVLNRAKSLVKKLIHFVYPADCIHCQEEAVDSDQLLCFYCKDLIERFPLDQCEPCKAVAVVKEGITLSLLKEVRGSLSQEVISTMAALMAVQMIELKWPLPDLIVPSNKDSINVLLAIELSKIFGVALQKKHCNCSDKIVLAVGLIEETLEGLGEAAPLQFFQISFCR